MILVEPAVADELELDALGLEATVEKVTDFPAIVGYGVMKTPGLVVDETVVLSGRVPTMVMTFIAGILRRRSWSRRA